MTPVADAVSTAIDDANPDSIRFFGVLKTHPFGTPFGFHQRN